MRFAEKIIVSVDLIKYLNYSFIFGVYYAIEVVYIDKNDRNVLKFFLHNKFSFGSEKKNK